MWPSTDTNTASDQWFYLHNRIFIVVVLILEHVLQKDLSLLSSALYAA